LDINNLKALSYEELRALYRSFLHSQNISKLTINTAYADTFYLWRKESKELFWNAVTATDFENEARNALIKALSENSTGNVKSLIGSYLSHLRRFRLFLASDGTAEPVGLKQEQTTNQASTRKKKMDVAVPNPSIEQVEFYLEKWDGLENYRLQEEALNKLFLELCPRNADISDVLLKASTLNNFYSTNIFSIYPVAKHICSLDIDSRLKAGDVTLVRDIQYLTISDTQKNFLLLCLKIL